MQSLYINRKTNNNIHIWTTIPYITNYVHGTSQSIKDSRILFTFSICVRRCIHIIAAAPSSTCNMQHACCKMTRLILLMLLHAAVCRFVCLFVCFCVFVALHVAACSYCCCCSFSGCCFCCFRLCTVALIIVSQTVACMCNLRLFTYSFIFISLSDF